MPTHNALAAAALEWSQPSPGAPYHVRLEVWSHSYDHPKKIRRSALVTRVSLAKLPAGTSHLVSNLVITDRFGVDHTRLWTHGSGGTEEGFDGYAEYDTGGSCGSGLPGVFWFGYTGIYDERCLADPTVDALRLQTYRVNGPQIAVFNYIVGPLTFSFDIVLPAPPTTVHLRLGHVGGNGGNPAQRSATLPDENFLIEFP